MGWTGQEFEGQLTPAKAVELALGEKAADAALAIKGGGGVAYAAVPLEEEKCIIGVVVLYERERGLAWTKLIDETMGPAEQHCPAAVLKELTDPPLNEWAGVWRAACRANLDATTPGWQAKAWA